MTDTRSAIQRDADAYAAALARATRGAGILRLAALYEDTPLQRHADAILDGPPKGAPDA